MFGSITNEALTIYAVGITAFAIVTNALWAKSEGFGAAFVWSVMVMGWCWMLFVLSLIVAASVCMVEQNGWL